VAASPATIANRPRPRLPSAVRRLAGGLTFPVGSVVFAFIIGGLIVAATGANPLAAYQGLVCGGLGIACGGGENPALQISNTIVFLIPLITAGIAVALPFRAGLFNIGAEGQLLAGSVACTAIGIKFSGLPTPIRTRTKSPPPWPGTDTPVGALVPGVELLPTGMGGRPPFP